MKRITSSLSAGALLAALLFGSTASADVPAKSFYVGLFGGANLVLDDWDLHDEADFGQHPDSSAIFGLRLGFHFAHWIALEAGLGVLPYTHYDDSSNVALSYSGDLLLYPFKGDWVPFVDIGAGLYHNVSGDTGGSDVDTHLHWGLGLRGMITEAIGLRLDARHMLTDAYETGGGFEASNLEITVGVDFFAWRESHEPPPPPDSDGDGLADPDDECPTEPGPKATGGCPDKDGDGIRDSDDRCPDEAGPKALQGCPDKDGDGIRDADDRCPDKAGPSEHKGCPDSDGDGLADVDDKCPDEAGPKSRRGCPIPKAVQEKFSGALEGIFFQTGSAKILKKSFPVLDDAAAVLLKFADITVAIEGHTDDRGKAEKNLKLSQDRADSVKQYLVDKGVKADRMETKGYGEEKPIGDNKTKDGRAKNRRIEFRVLTR